MSTHFCLGMKAYLSIDTILKSRILFKKNERDKVCLESCQYFFMISLSVSAPAESPLSLVEKRVSTVQIVIPEEASSSLIEASELLAECIYLSSGAEIPILSAGSISNAQKKTIFIGDTADLLLPEDLDEVLFAVRSGSSCESSLRRALSQLGRRPQSISPTETLVESGY